MEKTTTKRRICEDIGFGRYRVFCKECNKLFYIASTEWAYKVTQTNHDHSTKYFCSWHCLRAYQAAHQKRKKVTA